LFGDIPGFDVAGATDRRCDVVITEPKRGGDRPRTYRVDAYALRADLLGERFGEVQQGGLGCAVVDDQRVRQDGVGRAGADDGAGAAL